MIVFVEHSVDIIIHGNVHILFVIIPPKIHAAKDAIRYTSLKFTQTFRIEVLILDF